MVKAASTTAPAVRCISSGIGSRTFLLHRKGGSKKQKGTENHKARPTTRKPQRHEDTKRSNSKRACPSQVYSLLLSSSFVSLCLSGNPSVSISQSPHLAAAYFASASSGILI